VTEQEQPAYPFPLPGRIVDHQVLEFGLSKRELFSAMAMQAFCSNSSIEDPHDFISNARWAVKQADELIFELNKKD